MDIFLCPKSNDAYDNYSVDIKTYFKLRTLDIRYEYTSFIDASREDIDITFNYQIEDSHPNYDIWILNIHVFKNCECVFTSKDIEFKIPREKEVEDIRANI